MIYNKETIKIISNRFSIFISYILIIMKIIDDIFYFPTIIQYLYINTYNLTLITFLLKIIYTTFELLKLTIIPYYFFNHIVNIKTENDVSLINNNMRIGYFYHILIMIINFLIYKILNHNTNNF